MGDSDVKVKPSRKGEKSIKVTTQPVRLPRNVDGQNRKGARG